MSLFSRKSPFSQRSDVSNKMRDECEHLKTMKTRGELGKVIASIVLTYSPKDLAQMRWNFSAKIHDYTPDYRKRLEETITAHLHGTFQTIRLMNQQGSFQAMTDLIANNADEYWDMVLTQCIIGDDGDSLRYLKFLLSGFCMLVEQIPGHPVGMPFPGGDKVDLIEEIYYCPVRTKSNDVDAALCPFCPALQTPDIGYLKPPVHASKNKKQEYIKNCYDHHHFNG